jgi:hypothetical protein
MPVFCTVFARREWAIRSVLVGIEIYIKIGIK